MVNVDKINKASKRLEQASQADTQRINKIAKMIVRVLEEHQVTFQEVRVVLKTASKLINKKVNKFPIKKLNDE